MARLWPFLCSLPSLDVARALFMDFESNYRALDRWHLRQRTKIIQAKHFHHNKLLFKQLKSQKAGTVTHLKLVTEAKVVDVDGPLLDLDAPMDLEPGATWTLDGHRVSLEPTLLVRSKSLAQTTVIPHK